MSESEKAFVEWWRNHIVPEASPGDLGIANTELIKKAFLANYEPMKKLAERLMSWDENHPQHDKKAIEAFQAAGDMINQLLEKREEKQDG